MSAVLNLSAYRFTPLDDLPARRTQLLTLCHTLGLRGTILLSPEGINLFVAGPRAATDALFAELRTWPGLADFTGKESLSAAPPFGRMLVKIKREIIAFGVPGVDPARRPAPRLPARELKQWLDVGRPVTLLDTRNDYEVQAGTFHGAIAAGIGHFRDFPAAVARLPEALKQQDHPIVTFCTGGIRCEKAAPFLAQAGFQNVLQLDGGILKYFEECGGAHYEGACFVFDDRRGVDAALRPTTPLPAASPVAPPSLAHPCPT